MSTKSQNSFAGQSPRRSALEVRQTFADWLSTYRWSWYVTLTFSFDISRQAAYARLKDYLNDIEKRIGAPLSCFFVLDSKGSGLGVAAGRNHFHLLLECGDFIDSRIFSAIWRKPEFGGIRVVTASDLFLPYDPLLDASSYLLKNFDSEKYAECDQDDHWRMNLNSKEFFAKAELGLGMDRLQLRQARRYANRPSGGNPAPLTTHARQYLGRKQHIYDERLRKEWGNMAA